MISNRVDQVGGKTENKAACSECGNTDRFKDQFPICISKNKRANNENSPPNPTPDAKGENQKVSKQKQEKEVRNR